MCRISVDLLSIDAKINQTNRYFLHRLHLHYCVLSLLSLLLQVLSWLQETGSGFKEVAGNVIIRLVSKRFFQTKQSVLWNAFREYMEKSVVG